MIQVYYNGIATHVAEKNNKAKKNYLVVKKTGDSV